MQRPEYFSHVVQLNEEQLAYFLPFFQKSADEYEKQPDFYTLQSIALLLSILIKPVPGSIEMPSPWKTPALCLLQF